MHTFLTAATFNARIAWQIFVKDIPEGSSVAAILFGLTVAGGVLIMPVGILRHRLLQIDTANTGLRVFSLTALWHRIRIQKSEMIES